MDNKQGSFEGWCIVELFGRSQEIGFVTTEAYGQAVMFRVDVPDLPEREIELKRPSWEEVDGKYQQWPAGTKVKREAVPGRTRLLGPGSVYALNPCTEEAARAAIEKHSSRKLMLISMPPAGLISPPEDDELDDDDDETYEQDDEVSISEAGEILCITCNKNIAECQCAHGESEIEKTQHI